MYVLSFFQSVGAAVKFRVLFGDQSFPGDFMRHLSVIGASFLAMLLSCPASLLAADPKIEEQLIAPPGGRSAYVLSQRGLHVAVAGMSGSRMKVTVDGVEGPVVDQILMPNGQPFAAANTVGVSEPGEIGLPVLFSPEGDHYAYAARMGNDAVIFFDGKEIARGPFNASVLNFGPMCFSPGGKHFSFILTNTTGGVKRQFFMDGKPLPIMPQQNPPAVLFSPDDSHYAYYGQNEERTKSFLVLDGKDAGYMGDEPQFTADNRLLTMGRVDNKAVLQIDGKPSNHGEGVLKFLASKPGNKIITFHARPNPGGQLHYLVVDGKKVDETECVNMITKVVFSPDGKRYMARCVGQGQMWMVIDGKKELTYNGIGDDFGFSADSTKYAYLASSPISSFFVVDGKESEVGKMGAKPIFSPKGARVAYVTGENRLMMTVNVDDKASGNVRDVATVVFSPDGSRYAYQYNTMQSASLNVDGAEQPGLIAGSFMFSPDSKHVLVSGQRPADRQNGLFLDGQLIYRQTGRFFRQVFSENGKHFYWGTVQTGQPVLSAVYVNGKLVGKYDMNANNVFEQMPESWSLSADGVLTFLAFTPEGLKKIKVTPPEDSSVDTMVAELKAAEEKAAAEAAAARGARGPRRGQPAPPPAQNR